MKRKLIYSFLLICSLGLFSSANQTKKPADEKSTCCKATTLQAKASEQSDMNLAPLNLFLFDM